MCIAGRTGIAGIAPFTELSWTGHRTCRVTPGAQNRSVQVMKHAEHSETFGDVRRRGAFTSMLKSQVRSKDIPDIPYAWSIHRP